MSEVLTLILGGGRGTRLFPLTRMRSKPAVPIGGKYRLIDVPISNCLHAGFRQIFVLTQFNSASLNRHIAQTYRLDHFTHGFVEVLAAEQTPEHSNWFQGTADAVRQAMRHFVGYDAAYYLILAGDHLYRMDFTRMIAAHVESGADVTIGAQPIGLSDASSMGILLFDERGQIVGFEEKPAAARLSEIRSTYPPPRVEGDQNVDRPFVASMGIYVFSRHVLIEILEESPGVDFGREIIPATLSRHRVRAYFYSGYWADVGTIESFYAANLVQTEPHAPFTFYDAESPIFTHPRFLPGCRIDGCTLDRAIVAEGTFLDRCTIDRSVVGIRMHVGRGAHVSRSVLLGADFYEDGRDRLQAGPPLGVGRDAVLERVIVDKNARIGDGARLVNERNVPEADADNYHIRSGIIVVPKGATIPAGAVI